MDMTSATRPVYCFIYSTPDHSEHIRGQRGSELIRKMVQYAKEKFQRQPKSNVAYFKPVRQRLVPRIIWEEMYNEAKEMFKYNQLVLERLRTRNKLLVVIYKTSGRRMVRILRGDTSGVVYFKGNKVIGVKK